MRILLISLWVLSAVGLDVYGQTSAPAQSPSEKFRLTEAGRLHDIALHLTVDDLPFEEYWTRSIHAVFDFADRNADGSLRDDELRLVPSARAVRLSLGTGFTPPVAPEHLLKALGINGSSTCTKQDLTNYYRRNGVGRVTIGHGKLPHTAALSKAISQALDQDQDQSVTEAEWSQAEIVLRRLDANDDELIGVGELLPNASYPGNWATNPLRPAESLDLAPAGEDSLILKRIESNNETRCGSPTNSSIEWRISIGNQVRVSPLHLTSKTRGDSWSVPGVIDALHHQLREELGNAIAERQSETNGDGERSRRPSRAWMISLVDRDGNGAVSPAELEKWLALQRQLTRGHLLISIYHGGGLFELLDTNHDAGLSVRELREGWRTLAAASCITENRVDLLRIPQQVLFVVSQGYPCRLARTTTPDVEWFRNMDRNTDGDVSRREFHGASAAFKRLDQDHDGLISLSEAQTPATLPTDQ